MTTPAAKPIDLAELKERRGLLARELRDAHSETLKVAKRGSPSEIVAATSREAALKTAIDHMDQEISAEFQRQQQAAAQEKREATINKMVQLDRTAERHCQISEEIAAERQRILADLEARAARAIDGWQKCYGEFVSLFCELESSARSSNVLDADATQRIDRLLSELRKRGATLRAVRYSPRGIGRSHIDVLSLAPIGDSGPKKAT